MINFALGSAEEVRGRPGILTRKGSAGHAVYGPYERIEPGDYIVSFYVETTADAAPRRRDLLAVIDVSYNGGNRLLVRQEIRGADLAGGSASFVVPFTIAEPCRAEYRMWVSGREALRVEDNRLALRASPDFTPSALVDDAMFPQEVGRTLPFFAEHERELLALHDKGMRVRIVKNEVRITAPGGIVLSLRTRDDLNFIGELFFENAYNIRSQRSACVIDIGMNIGLASLQFASKQFVQEVHSFEPFPETFSRAVNNIALNAALQSKIVAYPYGLSDHDYDGPIAIDDHGCSGSMTTVGVRNGKLVDLCLRDAGTLLAPIINDAHRRGLDIVMKVDCEGSEFAVFDSLARAGLLTKVRAFLVEWHAMFDDKSQETLLAPLEAAGFFTIDRSPPNCNGFFYAIRVQE